MTQKIQQPLPPGSDSGESLKMMHWGLWLITATCVSATVLMHRHGMKLDIKSCTPAIGTFALLSPFAFAFHRRNVPQFVNLLSGFLCMVVFNLSLTILTYAGTPLECSTG